MNSPKVQVLAVALFERPVVLRLPFRFGAATVTACPQAFVRITALVNGQKVEGASAELMVPKWFDKNPALTHDDNFNQLRNALRKASEHYLMREPASAYALHVLASEPTILACAALGLPRLAAQFGPALLDKAVADAVLRAQSIDWVDGVGRGALGDPFSPKLTLQRASSVWVRHTVGLADRLVASDAGIAPDDGLPSTLSDAIEAYGLRYFKLKLSGNVDADIERLSRIEAVLARVPDAKITLDGNETFTDIAAIEQLFIALAKRDDTKNLLARTLMLEQPLPRASALKHALIGARLPVPVILDESDDSESVLDQGLALGYQGISSKACKGIYRSLASAALLQTRPGCLLSGEDLTCQAGLGVQQDCLLAASLGVSHIERNGHHYVAGFGSASVEETRDFLQQHPGLYRATAHGVRLNIVHGKLDLTSLHKPGFAHSASPAWNDLQAF